LTSSAGGAESETRIVSPMPRQQDAEGGRALDRALEGRPRLGDTEVQRPVAALGEQAVRLHHDDRVVVLDRDLEVVEVVLLEQDASQTALSTSASGVALPYFSSSRLSREPAFTPMRSDTPASFAAFAMAPTWSSNLRMLPGFTRTAPHPASIA
jgi:hypothetical protein